MSSVKLENVRKVYENGHEFVAVHDATMEIANGEFLVLVGPSGCGKSTILRMIAGLESISGGRLYIGDRLVNDVPPKDRDIAMVFQNYALYPHMSVHDNLAFGLKLRKLKHEAVEARVLEAAAILGIEAILDRKPSQLSGGQRQRVAVGRAIVRQPQVFLFDEPLSNLDARLRVQMRTEISRLHQRLGATMIYVTHDQVEAMTMGERIVVLHEGRIQQIDAPLALYERPVNLFVAGFIGSPAMNFIPGRISRDGGLTFRADGGAMMIPLDGLPTGTDLPQEREIVLGVRPENVGVTAAPTGASSRFVLELVEPMGNEIFVHARAGEHQVVARMPPRELPEPGTGIELEFEVARLHCFDVDTGERIAAVR